MRIPLHVKTTFLVSVSIIIVMAVTAFIFGSAVVSRIRDEQRDYAEAQAENLSQKMSDVLPLYDYERIVRLAEIFDQSRIRNGSDDGTKVWEFDGRAFIKRASFGPGAPGSDLPPEADSALRSGKEVKIEDTGKGVYRVIVPVLSSGNLVGAVEFSEQLETLSELSGRYLSLGISLTLVFLGLSALTVYALTTYFIYSPLKKIEASIGRFKSGDHSSRATIKGGDEIAQLGEELNKMFAQIEAFTKERLKQNELLENRVGEATDELRYRNRQLETANQEIWDLASRLAKFENIAAAGQTAAQFAHEVGTPLNLISGHVQLLENELEDDPSANKRLEVIAAQIARIERIVRSMLDRTRYGEGDYSPTDVNQVIRRVSELVDPRIRASGTELTFDEGEDIPLIEGDAERLQQVFLNLFSNALDAMPDGGKLKVRTYGDDDSLMVEVSDTGSGMPDEVKNRIFEPFFTTKDRNRGTGVGLTVVRHILHEHGATIEVESSEGEGTKITIAFPLENETEKE